VNRPYVIVHAVAWVDGRVSLGLDQTGFDDAGDEPRQAIWVSKTSLADSVRDFVSRYEPDVLRGPARSVIAAVDSRVDEHVLLWWNRCKVGKLTAG
jgi:hypothetical protein